jgi:hypothetical protein
VLCELYGSCRFCVDGVVRINVAPSILFSLALRLSQVVISCLLQSRVLESIRPDLVRIKRKVFAISHPFLSGFLSLNKNPQIIEAYDH